MADFFLTVNLFICYFGQKWCHGQVNTGVDRSKREAVINHLRICLLRDLRRWRASPWRHVVVIQAVLRRRQRGPPAGQPEPHPHRALHAHTRAAVQRERRQADYNATIVLLWALYRYSGVRKEGNDSERQDYENNLNWIDTSVCVRVCVRACVRACVPRHAR